MAVIKEEIINVLNELPDNASLTEIELVILEALPKAVTSTQVVQKQVQKIKKINRVLSKLIKKSQLNANYLRETIPIEKVRQSFTGRRDLFFG
ncbi:MAG: hypothetical protein ACFE75_03780 [Candidatus Hodarchaeota archaeon]